MTGAAPFVERFGLWTTERQDQARELVRRIDGGELDVVRFAFADQHGLLRGKTLVASEARAALWEGVQLTSTLLAKDSSHRSVFPVFSAGGGFAVPGLQGGADITLVADPTTFRVLPWTPRTGWLLCDAYMPDGSPCPYATRQILQRAVQQLESQGLAFVAGLEVEFHVFKLEDARLGLADSGQPGEPPRVSLLSHGHQYLTELRYDRVDPVMELLRSQLVALGLPLRSLEVEYGPSQFELTFGPTAGVTPADTMVLLRSAIKQICQRHGYHATFMCRPRIPNVMSSGWHLHQSLRRLSDGRNAFMPEAASGQPLSELGMHYLGGLKHHARGAAVLACPTINGYRRYRPHSLAPDRALWGRDNRGAMLRVLGGPGQAGTRIENRVGEPAANPYLYLASQLFSGMDGLQRQLDPGPSADVPYETPAEPLPRSLEQALACLRQDSGLCAQLGQGFVDYYCHIKEAEIARFNLEVSEWEHREYFDMF
ncbi:glutamine synthetase family protein [Ideonella azotifigens]|uniref:Glutamine synthetase family protein n=1 Tax=Ideonella azotifigens TaxID=513160 RepID=A0ABN1K4R9_9BURK|nr:glutamine synthetase family protein [Ideonella azotifigens]MCD2344477.1 glutamine synthetase family protein [Ideonella azotifigens]